jgi:AcrR family transcriptional regulator
MATATRAGRAGQRRPRHDPKETQREILDAAEGLLRVRPFREITVEQVMAATQLKRPAFYVHFRDRHDLVLQVVRKIGDELFEGAKPWLEGSDDPRQDAREALDGVVAVYLEHGRVLRALSDAAGSDEQVETVYRTLVQTFIDATASRIRREQRRGQVPRLHADETARALVWLVERYLSEALGREPSTDPATVVDVLYRIWVATLYGPPPTPS